MRNDVLDGVMGLAVADALGVPVEFLDREILKQNPVTNMRSYGTYNQPAGTWSDDTSLTLGLLDSLSEGLDYDDMMNNFMKWFKEGGYTPFDKVFDIGNTTSESLMRHGKGVASLECGGTSDYDNGNGSLMRILPIMYYLQSMHGINFIEEDESFDIIHNVSALTHAHKRSQIACGIYISVASKVSRYGDLKSSVGQGINQAIRYYQGKDDFKDELVHFDRLINKNFSELKVDEIKSSGYVVDTIEAAIWCLLNADTYEACVLKAVNLGEDTDTVGAVAGGLAGIHYGYKNIPNEWLEVLVKREYIEDLCNKLHTSLKKRNSEKLSAYIPFFETATKESVLKWGGGEKLGEKSFTMPHPIYDPKLHEFIQAVYETNLLRTDYLNVIQEHGLDSTEKMNEAIDEANFELLTAILTGYVRQERFGDGLWGQAVENKVFLNVLKRLQELM